MFSTFSNESFLNLRGEFLSNLIFSFVCGEGVTVSGLLSREFFAAAAKSSPGENFVRTGGFHQIPALAVQRRSDRGREAERDSTDLTVNLTGRA